eukprot:3940388-Rhodomonas_salina.6
MSGRSPLISFDTCQLQGPRTEALNFRMCAVMESLNAWHCGGTALFLQEVGTSRFQHVIGRRSGHGSLCIIQVE